VIFVFAVGLAFAYAAVRTRSILGVTMAHGLLNLGLLVVWPALF
jgi:membrane protease YdiL (CAAX protease family)